MNEEPTPKIQVTRHLLIQGGNGQAILIPEAVCFELHERLAFALGILPAPQPETRIEPGAIPPVPEPTPTFEEVHAQESVAPLADQVIEVAPFTPEEQAVLDRLEEGRELAGKTWETPEEE